MEVFGIERASEDSLTPHVTVPNLISPIELRYVEWMGVGGSLIYSYSILPRRPIPIYFATLLSSPLLSLFLNGASD